MQTNPYKPINGWTKASVIQKIKDDFTVKATGPSRFGNQESCKYRGNNGSKCFVGVFIPDSLYEQRMEGQSASCLADPFSNDFKELKKLLPFKQYTLDHFQRVHDQFMPEGKNEAGEDVDIQGLTCKQTLIAELERIVPDEEADHGS